MCFLIESDDLLEKYKAIWENVRRDIKKELDRESICSRELLKTKIKSHGDEVADFMIKNS